MKVRMTEIGVLLGRHDTLRNDIKPNNIQQNNATISIRNIEQLGRVAFTVNIITKKVRDLVE
jgi:hypothetical protein